jgi:magnesium-transporting ATPase (P-type)
MVAGSAALRPVAGTCLRSTLACGLAKTAAAADHSPLRRIIRPPYDIQPEQVARDLKTSLTHGLSDLDAHSRVAACGKNVIYEKRKLNVWLILWRQIANAITFVLVVSLVISFAVRDYPEGGVIAGN